MSHAFQGHGNVKAIGGDYDEYVGTNAVGAQVSGGNARGMTNPVTVRVMGLRSCMEDTLYQYNEPDPDTAFEILDNRVFTP